MNLWVKNLRDYLLPSLVRVSLLLALLIGVLPHAPQRAQALVDGPLFGAHSPFNTLIPPGATYIPEARIGTFRQSFNEWAAPVYRVPVGVNVPLVTVTNYGSGRIEHWPIPVTALPATAADHHLIVIHEGNSLTYEMWDATWVNSSNISAGGMTTFPIRGTGISYPPNRLVTGAGFAVSAGMIVREDFTDPGTGLLNPTRHINHALTMALPSSVLANTYVPPAIAPQSGFSGGVNGIPMGAQFALPPSLNVDALVGIYPFTRELLRAARDYGIYINDASGTLAFNGKAVATTRVEPGLIQDLYGVSGDTLIPTIQNEVFSIIAQHGIFRIASGTNPYALNDAYDSGININLLISAPGVLANDSHPQGLPMTAVLNTNASHGNVTLSPDGMFTYSPVANYQGVDSFSYFAFDGVANSSVPGIVTINVTPPQAPQVAQAGGTAGTAGGAGSGTVGGGDTSFVAKSVDKSIAQVGETVTFTLNIGNPKTNTLNNVVISDTLDARFDNVRVVSASRGAVIVSGNIVTVQGFSLQPGASARIVISATISSRAQPGDKLFNTATLESPDASIHISNGVEILIAPGSLPATGERSRADYAGWLLLPLLALGLLVGGIYYRKMSMSQS